MSPPRTSKTDRPRHVFQGVVIEVDELLRAEVESRLTAAARPGADNVRPGLTCELARHRTDYAGRPVHEDALPRVKAAVLEHAPAHAVRARHHEGAPTVKSTSPGSGVRLRASTATTPPACRRDTVREAEHRCPIDSPSCHSRER